MSRSSEHSVGYGKPPQHTQFRKGQSGNPKGRPKGRLNMATVLERELHEKVVINEGGQRRTITKLEAAMKQMVNKAASGDLKAFREMKALLSYAEQTPTEPANNTAALSPVDQQIMQNFLCRYGVRDSATQNNTKREQ